MSKKNISHIEFLGLPGSGKTTVYENITKTQLFDNLYFSNSIETKTLDNIITYVQNFSSVYDTLQRSSNYSKLIYRSMIDADFDKKNLLKLFLGTIVEYESNILYNIENKLNLFDELFIQRILSVRFRSDNSKLDVNKYINNIPLPSKVIYIDTPVDVCIQRQQSRNKYVNNEYWLNNIENGSMLRLLQKFCISIINGLEKKGVNVIKIDNTKPIDDVVNEILSNMNKSQNI